MKEENEVMRELGMKKIMVIGKSCKSESLKTNSISVVSRVMKQPVLDTIKRSGRKKKKKLIIRNDSDSLKSSQFSYKDENNSRQQANPNFKLKRKMRIREMNAEMREL